jgi:hypothetical protein
MVIWRFTAQNPTNAPELKVFPANDTVMRSDTINLQRIC